MCVNIWRRSVTIREILQKQKKIKFVRFHIFGKINEENMED